MLTGTLQYLSMPRILKLMSCWRLYSRISTCLHPHSEKASLDYGFIIGRDIDKIRSSRAAQFTAARQYIHAALSYISITAAVLTAFVYVM